MSPAAPRPAASHGDYPLAMLAGAAYAISPVGEVIDWRDIRAVVTTSGNGAVVAIRGTVPTSLDDWERDLEVWTETLSVHAQLGPCHRGFLEAAVGLYPLLAPLLAGKRCMVTGHSLGGAVAVLLAALMILDGTPPDLLVTWEAPRAGGAMLARALIKVAVRQYRYGNDPVTEVPWCPGVYQHVREPLVRIGHALLDPIAAHSIDRIIQWGASCSQGQLSS